MFYGDIMNYYNYSITINLLTTKSKSKLYPK